jgi:hypothetical protein
MQDGTMAQVTLVGSESESQNHKLDSLCNTSESCAYLSPKTTRGQDGDSG